MVGFEPRNGGVVEGRIEGTELRKRQAFAGGSERLHERQHFGHRSRQPREDVEEVVAENDQSMKALGRPVAGEDGVVHEMLAVGHVEQRDARVGQRFECLVAFGYLEKWTFM